MVLIAQTGQVRPASNSIPANASNRMVHTGHVKTKGKPQSVQGGMTVGQIAAPFLTPAGAADADVKWSVLETSFPDMLWGDREPREVIEGELYERSATILDMAKLGSSFITFSGSKTAVSEVDISTGGPLSQPFGFADFSRVLRGQFGPKASIKLIRGRCPEETPKYPSSIYEVAFEGKKPVYLMLYLAPIRSEPDKSAISSSIDISRQIQETWKCGSKYIWK